MSSPSPIVRLSLPLMTAVIAGLTLLALVLVVEIHGGIWRYAFFAIPAIVAVYLSQRVPGSSRTSRTSSSRSAPRRSPFPPPLSPLP